MPARKRIEKTGETTNLAEAAKRLGVGLNQCYAAAKRGEIPTVLMGRRMLVPTAWLDKLLGGEPAPELLLPVSERRKAKKVRSGQNEVTAQ